MIKTRYSVRARYLFPVDQPPLRDACLTVEGGRIIAVGTAAAKPVQDLGQVALLPGLINPHTHLEFSRLEVPLGTSGMPLPDWIRRVVAWRNSQRDDVPAWRDEAIQCGLHESLAAGVTTMGEIATLPLDPWDRYEALNGTAFLELLGLDREQEAPLLAAAERFVMDVSVPPSVVPGLSPHAPYTVPPRLVERVIRISRRNRLTVAMHLAESREELQLLEAGSGPLVEMLEELNAWRPGVLPTGLRPADYLNMLARAPRSLVIHGNYLTPDEIAFAGQRREQLAIVYCPRTHAYFGHSPYPLAKMLQAGARVAVGTDSRASNPDLSLLNELRFVAAAHPHVDPEAILRMGTSNAAWALGVDDQRGSLTPGKQADFIALPISERDAADPHELLFQAETSVTAAYRAGVPVWQA